MRWQDSHLWVMHRGYDGDPSFNALHWYQVDDTGSELLQTVTTPNHIHQFGISFDFLNDNTIAVQQRNGYADSEIQIFSKIAGFWAYQMTVTSAEGTGNRNNWTPQFTGNQLICGKYWDDDVASNSGAVWVRNLENCESEICDNGIDDDSDGLIDCDDSECLPGTFFDSGQSFGNSYSIGAAIGDIDSDGDLDVWIANSIEDQADQLWLNDGTGQFSNSGQILGNSNNYNVEFGDIDGDGDLDAITTGRAIPPFPPSRVWFNDGAGIFTVSDQSLPNALRARLGDLDLDGDLDAWLSRAEPGLPNLVFLNNGQGEFIDSGQTLESSFTYDVFLSDLDADGDLDAFAANNSLQPNRVWLNDGAGFFFDSGQSLGNGSSHGVALGDVDNDGDLDAWIANSVAASTGGQPNRVWINDGMGNFTDSGQRLGNSVSAEVALGDLDGDGDLDAWVANAGPDTSYTEPNRVWINDGQGNFSDGGQSLGDAGSFGIVLGDLDGDSDLDAWVANIGPNRIWINQGHISCFIDEICDNGIDDDSDGLIDCDDSECAPGEFVDSGQALSNSYSRDVAMGDVDSDGDLDALVANEGGQVNRVWINQGGDQGGTAGNFSDSGQALGNSFSLGVSLDDLDGDGDLDAWILNGGVWLNDGLGNFADNGQSLRNSGYGLAIGDLDSDGDLDAWVTSSAGPNQVWMNDGLGNFTDSGQLLGDSLSLAVSLGDLDGDGDLDAWVANNDGQPNRVWVNDGLGNFFNSNQALGGSYSLSVSLGDLDGDGDLDAWVANYIYPNGQPNHVWINDGSGNFTDSGQALGNSISHDVSLGDYDGDGDLDAWVANNGAINTAGAPNKIWLNDGFATFTDSGQTLGNSNSSGVAPGDLDGDGDLDAWVANWNQPNRIWINQGAQPCGPDVDVDGIPNECDIDQTQGDDCDGNGEDDNCQVDTDADGTIDVCDDDLDGDGIPNECDVDQVPGVDQNADGILDSCQEFFIRGDCNTIGTIDIADGIFLLGYLFSGFDPSTCADACDVNDDAAIDISDAIFILAALFTGGDFPPAPFPDCGVDPTDDLLDCESFGVCP